MYLYFTYFARAKSLFGSCCRITYKLIICFSFLYRTALFHHINGLKTPISGVKHRNTVCSSSLFSFVLMLVLMTLFECANVNITVNVNGEDQDANINRKHKSKYLAFDSRSKIFLDLLVVGEKSTLHKFLL